MQERLPVKEVIEVYSWRVALQQNSPPLHQGGYSELRTLVLKSNLRAKLFSTRAGDEPETKSAALLLLMATIESSTDPKALASTAKHRAFTRCGELNLYGMVEAR